MHTVGCLYLAGSQGKVCVGPVPRDGGDRDADAEDFQNAELVVGDVEVTQEAVIAHPEQAVLVEVEALE